MAAVHGVVTFRVKPGRYGDLFEALKVVKGIGERLGVTVIVSRQTIGPASGEVAIVFIYPDYATFAKVSTDPELQRFLEAARADSNPAYDQFTVSLGEEVVI
jgi:hypothetical protein